jgi:ketosteroid isomerase-like protein
MKHIPLILVSALVVVLSTSSLPAADEKSKDVEHTILKLEQQWGDALVKRDQATIDHIAGADWVLIDTEGSILSKAKVDSDLKSGTIAFESFQLDDLKVRVFGDTVIAYGLETEKSKYDGKDTSGQYRFTDVFIKRDGRWQAVSTHMSRVTSK